jgi:hypothetical protein
MVLRWSNSYPWAVRIGPPRWSVRPSQVMVDHMSCLVMAVLFLHPVHLLSMDVPQKEAQSRKPCSQTLIFGILAWDGSPWPVQEQSESVLCQLPTGIHQSIAHPPKLRALCATVTVRWVVMPRRARSVTEVQRTRPARFGAYYRVWFLAFPMAAN